MGEPLNLPRVLSLNDVARHLCLFHRNGEPNRKAVQDLVRQEAFPVVGGHWTTVPIQRWTVSEPNLRTFIEVTS
jgi:hypothetical protein